MAVEEFLLFALAVIYFVIPYGRPPREPRERQGDENKDTSRSRHNAGRLTRAAPAREPRWRNF